MNEVKSNIQISRSHLKLKRIAIDTHKENVAYINRRCHLYHSEGFLALSKVEVKVKEDDLPLLAVLNIVDDDNIIAPCEIGLSEQAFDQLGANEDCSILIDHAAPPKSLHAVHKKISGGRPSSKDYSDIIKDISENRYSKIEIAAFLVACAETGMEREEVLHLTKAMFESGEKLNWGEPLVVDKHCIGGIPGNRTTPLVVSIVAAHGMLIPKTSSRAITSPAGTADTIEVVCNVELPIDKLKEIVKKERGFMAWGGTAKLAPVDDILITVERPLSLDSPGQMVASILSKKLGAGSTHLLLDIPIGPSAKVKNIRGEVLRIRKLFEYVADNMGLHLEAVITDGRQPIGKGIGPVLEMRDVLEVLEMNSNAPNDLREKSLMLAGRILEFDPDVRGGRGYQLAKNILDSGRALEKFKAIVKEQGKNEKIYTLGKHIHKVYAQKDGMVISIDNQRLARIARLAGAPIDKGAGVDLNVKLGEQVKQGQELYSIYAQFPADFNFAIKASQRINGYIISEKKEKIEKSEEFIWNL